MLNLTGNPALPHTKKELLPITLFFNNLKPKLLYSNYLLNYQYIKNFKVFLTNQPSKEDKKHLMDF